MEVCKTMAQFHFHTKAPKLGSGFVPDLYILCRELTSFRNFIIVVITITISKLLCVTTPRHKGTKSCLSAGGLWGGSTSFCPPTGRVIWPSVATAGKRLLINYSPPVINLTCKSLLSSDVPNSPVWWNHLHATALKRTQLFFVFFLEGKLIIVT